MSHELQTAIASGVCGLVFGGFGTSLFMVVKLGNRISRLEEAVEWCRRALQGKR